MGILVVAKYLSTLRTKRKPHLHARQVPLLIGGMPFGLCNAPSTFQRCMMVIFSDHIDNFMEEFLDDFSVFGSSFDVCLANLSILLKRCEEVNLILSWEKSHFMVHEGMWWVTKCLKRRLRLKSQG